MDPCLLSALGFGGLKIKGNKARKQKIKRRERRNFEKQKMIAAMKGKEKHKIQK